MSPSESGASLPTEYFDRMYAADPDPWQFAGRRYEQRKYALTLASLPRERYRRGFEPGCSIGVLTAGLAGRCDTLLAGDAAADAVRTARERLAGRSGVRVERIRIPDDWPAETFDLIVLSEVGDYLDARTLDTVVDAVTRALEPGGDLVLLHWRHPVADYPLTGDQVHDALGRWPRLSRVEDNDAEYVGPLEMLAELRDDNKNLTANMRELHEVTDEAKDVSTTSLLEEWIDHCLTQRIITRKVGVDELFAPTTRNLVA